MNKKISVIVPAYNVEDYIEKCVSSILTQTYRDIEVIIVDDGSKDATSKICDKIAKTDKRVRVIHQKNQGLSEARNNGIEVATGDVISLVDGDDILEANFLQNMHSSMRKNTDIVIGGYKIVDASGATIDKVRHDRLSLSGAEAAVELLTKQDDLFVIAWNKLYRRDLFIKNDIWYPAGRIHEDNLTTYKLLSKARGVEIIESNNYLYVKRAGSITNTTKKSVQVQEKINAAKEAIDYFPEGDLREAARYSLFLARIIELNEAIRAKKSGDYKKIISEISILNPSKNKYCPAKGKIYSVLLGAFSGMPYVLFRKIIDKVL